MDNKIRVKLKIPTSHNTLVLKRQYYDEIIQWCIENFDHMPKIYSIDTLRLHLKNAINEHSTHIEINLNSDVDAMSLRLMFE